MANIQKRINKKGELSFLIRVSCGYTFEHKQIIKSATFKPNKDLTEKQAFKAAEKYAILFEDKCKSNCNTCEYRHIKFCDLAEEWLTLISTTKEQKQSSIERLKSCRERTYKAIGNTYVDKLSYRQIQQFIINLSKDGVNQRTGKGLSTKSQKHYLSFISDVMQYAIRCEIITNNPCKNVSVVKTEKSEKRIYSLEELKAILNVVNEKSSTEHKAFIFLSAFLGLRRAEVLGLGFGDFDFKESTVEIVRTSNYRNKYTGIYTDTTKTLKSSRKLSVPDSVMDLVKELQKEKQEKSKMLGDSWHKSDRLFTQWNGLPMNPNTPYTWLKRFCEREGLHFYGLHSFRHTFATLAITNGADFKTISSILGHSQTSTTINLYTHSVDAVNKKAMNTVAELIR